MDNPDLTSCRAKLRWAERRHNELIEACETFHAQMRDEMKTHTTLERDTDGSVWSVNWLDDFPDPPEDLEHLAGEVVHSSRSALDHLACALVTANGTSPSKRNAFPIYEQRPTGQDLRNFETAVRGIAPDQIEAIKQLQPYENPGAPEGRKLIRLAALDNLDKHRDVVPVGLASRPMANEPTIFFQRPSQPLPVIINEGPLARGSWFMKSREDDPEEALIPVAFYVSFGGLGYIQLGEIRAYVVGIVESFGPAFN